MTCCLIDTKSCPNHIQNNDFRFCLAEEAGDLKAAEASAASLNSSEVFQLHTDSLQYLRTIVCDFLSIHATSDMGKIGILGNASGRPHSGRISHDEGRLVQ